MTSEVRDEAIEQRQRKFTGDDLLRMRDDERYELIEGELVEMAATSNQHSTVEFWAARVFDNYAQEHDLGDVGTGETGFYTRDNKFTVRAADAVLFPVDAEVDAEGFTRVPPLVVVEVISPSNTAEEMAEKVQEWLSFGVQMVLVLYPRHKGAHVFYGDGTYLVLQTDDILDGRDVLPGFQVQVRAFFESPRKWKQNRQA